MPAHDAALRDFTINAVFYNPASGNVIDYAGGIQDIENNILRFNGSARDRITEDPLLQMFGNLSLLMVARIFHIKCTITESDRLFANLCGNEVLLH